MLAAALAFFPKRLPRAALRMASKGEYLQRNEVRSFAGKSVFLQHTFRINCVHLAISRAFLPFLLSFL